jgi:excisionase family DNA binding protein
LAMLTGRVEDMKPFTIQFDNPATNAAAVLQKARDERLLTVQEVANLLHVPTSWVYERTRRAGSDQLPHVKLGKYVRFEEAAVIDFIRRQRCA